MRKILVLSLVLFGFVSGNSQFLNYGDDLTATISEEGEKDTYKFNGTAGNIIQIRMRGLSQGVDGCFQLIDPAGNIVAQDCDDGGIVQVSGIQLSMSGTYSLEAKDHNDNDTGEYGLSLELLNGMDGVQMISCGTDLIDEFTSWTEVKQYGLSVLAGDQIMVQMRGVETNIECKLQMLDLEGNIVAEQNTLSGLAIISDYTIPNSGIYKIAAFDGNGNDLGKFGLSVQLLNQFNCATDLQNGTNINSTFNQVAQIDAYTINCAAGDNISVKITDESGPIELNLIFCDGSGQLISNQIDENEITVNYTVPSTGEYNLILSDDKGNDLGDYSIILEGATLFADAIQIECGNSTFNNKLETEEERDVYQIKAEANEVANLRVRGYDNGIDPDLKIYNSQGILLAENSAFGKLVSIENFVFPTNDYYYITVQDLNTNDIGLYGFSFEKVNLDVCATELDCTKGTSTATFELYAEMDIFEFKGEAEQMATILMEEVTTALDPSMKLYSPSGVLLFEDSKSFHVDLTNFSLPETGTYVVVCSDEFGNELVNMKSVLN